MSSPRRALRALIALVCVGALAACSTPKAGPVALGEGWRYRWGDSPRDAEGRLLWLAEASGAGWREIDYPSNPPGRDGEPNAWFSVRLPELPARDPALFIYSIDVNAELYLDGRLLYAWGELDADGKGEFRGWPWHLVELPPDAGGSELMVRVYSNYRDIGLWGRIIVGSRADLLSELYVRDAPRLAVAAASLLLAVALIALSLLQRPRQPLSLHLGLATVLLIVRVVSRTHLKQLVVDAPLAWVYVSHASIVTITILLVAVVDQLLAGAFRRVATVLWAGLAAALAVSLTLSLGGLVGIQELLPVFDPVLVAPLLALLAMCTASAVRGNREALLLLAGLAVVGAITAWSILVSSGLIAWSDEIDYLVVFGFSLCVTVIVMRRVVAMQRQLEGFARTAREQSARLAEANEALERKVADRTRELELANRRLVEEKQVLQVASITDALTGLNNRTYVLDRLRGAVSHAGRYGETLSIVMFDLDHFKEVNDTWGHPAGDDVLRRVARVFASSLRESDLAGRYGGEEFLVVLPKADAAEACLVAERIRASIEGLRIRAGEHRLTVSGGVAELAGQSDENLLAEADRSLYRAKQAGRNRIERTQPSPQ